MGAVASTRHRSDESCGYTNSSPLKKNSYSSHISHQSDTHIAKKPRLSLLNQAREFFGVSRLCKYPRPKPQLKRVVHAPSRVHRFGSGSNSCKAARNWQRGIGEGVFGDDMGNALRVRRKCEVSREDLLRPVQGLNKGPETDKEVTFDDSSVEVIENVEDTCDDSSVEVIENVEDTCDDSSVEAIENVEDQHDGGLVVSNHRRQEANGFGDEVVLASSSDVSHMTKVEDAGKMLKSLSLSPERYLDDAPVHKKLIESANRYNPKLHRLHSNIQLQETIWESYKSLRSVKKPEEVEAVDSAHLREPFAPLTEAEEEAVERALSNSKRREVLVSHESSSIEITGELLQCLRPRAWLNDEVVNLYLELLKERENREPKKFLRCHFCSTFFYKRLTGGRNGYDYKSVRRWTTQKKLGYGLIECDKIFVPIHKEVHWCLAVINKKDKKFQYLDSLGGKDSQVLKVLARYFVDEVKDKCDQDIDVSAWEYEFVKDLPAQQNGFDCGMFMIKYADFYSRGMGLDFGQEHMPYFRLRTAKEILQLRAD